MNDVLVLDETAVAEHLDLAALVDALADGFAALSDGDVVAPARVELGVPAGFLLAMPGWRKGAHMAVKLVNVFAGNPALGLPSHQAVICLFDAETGSCAAVLDGTFITAVRTAGAAALSARLLAREDARTLTIVGAGAQGRSHLALLPLVREVGEICIASRRYEDAERLAATHPRARAVESVEEAVRTSDVVCLCTHAAEPVVDAAWIRPGTHVTSVGYRPPRGELDPALVEGARLFVETRLAFEPVPVGCAELAGRDPASGTELGEIVLGSRPGRESADEITLYKAMGHAVEDLVAAELAYRSARASGAGFAATL